MTQETKKVWSVLFKDSDGVFRRQRVAANNLKEVLSYFNEESQNNIIELTIIEEEVTIQYEPKP